MSAARQKREWQKAVIQSILRQNVGWYDTSNPEQLTSKIGSQVELVFKGLEGPVYNIFVALGAAVTGVVGGVTKDWKITLVLLSVCPAIVLSVAALATVLSTSTKKQNRAYGKAGGLATEALFAMRTISALGLEDSFIERYSKSLSAARAAMITSRCQLGICTGVLFSTFILLQAAGFSYGGFQFSDELSRSSYEYNVNRTQEICFNHPVAGQVCQNVTAELHFCSYKNNTPANVSINAPCDAPYQPLQMNCQLARLLESFDKSPSGAFNAANMTMLQLIGQVRTRQRSGHAASSPPPLLFHRLLSCGRSRARARRAHRRPFRPPALRIADAPCWRASAAPPCLRRTRGRTCAPTPRRGPRPST